MMTTYDDAKTTKAQHKSPCHDCPWRRVALPGWLAGDSIPSWLLAAHGDGKMECHTTKRPDGGSHECAGAAIYRANVCKSVAEGNLELPHDKERVFGTPAEFATHHSRGKINPKDLPGLMINERLSR